MTILVTDDFSTDTSADYDGVTLTIAGGVATPSSSDGMSLHSTEIPGNEVWARIIVADSPEDTAAFSIGTAVGNGFLLIMAVVGANLVIDWLSEYDTYTSYAGNDDDLNLSLGTFNAANEIGITIDRVNNVMRLWYPVTAAEPDSLTSWDGDVTPNATVNYGALGQTGGTFLGIGTWDTSAPRADDFSRFAAGVIGGGAAGPGLLPLFAGKPNVLLRM